MPLENRCYSRDILECVCFCVLYGDCLLMMSDRRYLGLCLPMYCSTTTLDSASVSLGTQVFMGPNISPLPLYRVPLDSVPRTQARCFLGLLNKGLGWFNEVCPAQSVWECDLSPARKAPVTETRLVVAVSSGRTSFQDVFENPGSHQIRWEHTHG